MLLMEKIIFRYLRVFWAVEFRIDCSQKLTFEAYFLWQVNAKSERCVGVTRWTRERPLSTWNYICLVAKVEESVCENTAQSDREGKPIYSFILTMVPLFSPPAVFRYNFNINFNGYLLINIPGINNKDIYYIFHYFKI